MTDFSRHDLRIAAADHYVRAIYGEAKWFDTEEEMQDYITGRNKEMDKKRTEDEETLEGIQHFSNYMHEVANQSSTNGMVYVGCMIVAHIADGILHAVESLEADETE